MKKLGRPRKAHALRKENISVNLPKSLVSQVESKLSYNGSRSKWIQTAIEGKLKSHSQLQLIESDDLVYELFHRLDKFNTNQTLTNLYIHGLKPIDSQVEETVTE